MSVHTVAASSAPLLARYRNGGYEVALYADGTKSRLELDEAMPPRVPEQLDLKITGWCDAGCVWCHESATRKGRHADISQTLDYLRELPAGAEVAIGGGDPLAHPEFERLVRGLRAQGAVPSVTVNGRHLARHRAMLEDLTAAGCLFGVGVSYHDQLPLDWEYPHLVVHLIAGVHSPSVLDAAKRRLKVLLLGYKEHGRGRKLFAVRSHETVANIEAWRREIFWIAHEHHLSFDQLAIEQLEPLRLFHDPAAFARRYMGVEGQFSLYVDAVTQTGAVSSYSDQRWPWASLPQLFARVRASQGLTVAA
jgi:hypothetical protein